jgi:hypothetical protein
MQLFEPIVEKGLFHPNFRSIMAVRNGFNLDVINDWAKGFVDRDGKFVKEFQTTFNSSFWELYLFAVLKKYGMQVDFSEERPDFCIPGKDLNVEATVASHSYDAQPEYARLAAELPNDLNEFNLKTIIRLSNSIVSKHKKYVSSYSRLNHVSRRAFAVAVANFDQPHSFMACHRPIEAVLHCYYVDEERYMSAGRQSGKPLTGQRLSKLFKDNDSPIELGIFTTPAYKEISAIIFSGCATWGKVRALSLDPNLDVIFTALRLNLDSDTPHVIRCTKEHYEENLLDGLRIYHNPFATHPIDPALFRDPSVFQSYHSDHGRVYEQRDGQLLFRCVETRLSPSSHVVWQSSAR